MPGTTTAAVDSAFIFIMVFCFLLFALIIFFTIFLAVRYRRSSNPTPADISGHGILEAAFIAATVVLALAMFFYGLTGFKFLKSAPSDSLAVHVTARQWSWLFTYDNGRKSTDLVVPQGNNIALTMEASDVIHGFFVPDYRIKQDVVPGMKTYAWFKAVSIGSSDILCTQYCGVQHSKMLASVYVVSPEDYKKWYNGEEVDIPGLTSEATVPRSDKLLADNGCLGCHSLDGKKLVGPTFKGLFGAPVKVNTGGKQRTIVADQDYLEKSISDPSADIVEGFADQMPRVAYTSEQVHEMAELVAAVQ
jgi:cytochrome c oxidase subunit 2